MRTIEDIIKGLPEDLRTPIYELAEALKEEFLHHEIRHIREDLNSLKNVVMELIKAQHRTEEKVHELAEAQKKTEERLTRLENTVQELAEAQKKTEERLTRLENTVQELAEAQKKTEERLTRLENTVQELAEAQKRTEQRVSELAEAQKRTEERLTKLENTVQELAEAQKRTEQRVSELAEAQKRTEEEIKNIWHAIERLTESHERLVKEHAETRRQLGGLSMTVGYTLENEAFKALPRLLKQDFGIEVKGKLKRRFVKDNKGEYIEVNIFGKGEKDGKEITIIGEGKVQLSKRNVDQFIRKRLKRLEGKYKDIFPVLVTHMVSQPDVEEYVKEKGIALYYSFDF